MEGTLNANWDAASYRTSREEKWAWEWFVSIIVAHIC
jgi:hypothetical protein